MQFPRKFAPRVLCVLAVRACVRARERRNSAWSRGGTSSDESPVSSSCSSIYLTENVAEGKGLIAPKLPPAETLYGGRKCPRGVVRTFAGRTSAVLGTQPARLIVSLFSLRFFFSPRHACICVYVVEVFPGNEWKRSVAASAVDKDVEGRLLLCGVVEIIIEGWFYGYRWVKIRFRWIN